MTLALPDGMADGVLLPQRVTCTEAVCGGIELRVYCVSLDVGLPLKELIGIAGAVHIVTDVGELRSICGIVTEVSQGESDGGLATYQLVLRDALAILDLTAGTRIFLDKTELEVVRILLTEARRDNPALAAAFEFCVDAALAARNFPRRRQIMQYNESTAGFVRRLLRRRGISWYFRPGHAESSDTEGDDDAPIHTMVLFADGKRLVRSPAGRVRFHRDNATEERDTITAWCGVRTLQPGRQTNFSWDYANPRGTGFMTAGASSEADQGARGNRLAAQLERYVIEAPHVRDSADDLGSLAQQTIARSDFEAKCYYAEGGVRACRAGEYFTLDDHPDLTDAPDEQREFIVLSQQIVAQNNLPKTFDARVERLFARNRWDSDGPALPLAARNWFDAGEMRFFIRMHCVRRDIRFVPSYDPRSDRPRAEMQSAIVVGPAGEEVHCDELGRIKVRFGGMRECDHAHADGAGASGTDADSAWVRLATNWAGSTSGAGSHVGALSLPRAGTEVLIAFLGGDPDKPVVIGQLYNAAAHPPHLGTDGLPGNRYVSGLQSREVKGSRVNQLRLDDTPGEISAQLASEHGRSELNLGFLTQPRTGGTAAGRGEGAELTTDQQMALRAGKGMLLSAWRRLGGGGKQLDRSDCLALMEECVQLFRSLGDYAASHEGLPVDGQEQAALQASLKEWDKGGAPAIAVTAPDGISFATSKAIVSYAATNVDTVAQQHLQLTAGQRYNVNAGKGISLFSHADGLHAIAHHGPLVMQSQHDTTQIDSGKDVKISARGRVIIMAEEVVLVNKDGAYLALKGGGPEIGGPGAMTVKTNGHNWNGSASRKAELPSFGEGQFVRTPRVVRSSDGEPVKDFELNLDVGGARRTVKTNSAGEGEKITADHVQVIKALADPEQF
ncbi:type VI secretion system Vgr family protein [Pseudoduganella flava]|nr:type VI secretion system Vgr family protein [Pseudoduganella flava]